MPGRRQERLPVHAIRGGDGGLEAFRYPFRRKNRRCAKDFLGAPDVRFLSWNRPRRCRALLQTGAMETDGEAPVAWLRDIDVWFADHVFAFHQQSRRYAMSLLRDEDEAEELVQEAYARLFTLEDWRGIANPHAYTLRIIRNLAVERFRRADVVRIDQGAALQMLEVPDDDPTPDRVALDRSELHQVVQAMEQMPPRMREALTLRRIDGLPPGQVAERMDISVSTVETHLVKALRFLMQAVDRTGKKADTEQSRAWEKAEKLERS